MQSRCRENSRQSLFEPDELVEHENWQRYDDHIERDSPLHHMKAFITLVAFLLSAPPATSAQEPATVAALSWLAGCWASVGGEAGSGEQWTVPAGKTMLGTSRTVRNTKTVAYEFLQIRQTEAGEIEYVAKPSGQAEAAFLLVRLSEREVVFENPDHDFPQRIMYRLRAEGNLEARIEGTVNGEVRTVDFPMERVDCELNRTGNVGERMT